MLDFKKSKENETDSSFEELICLAYDEFIFQCNSASQEFCIGAYGDIHNFRQARDLCRKISEELCYNWEEIVTSLEYYFNLISTGKEIKLTRTEQIELLDEFDMLIDSFPTYINNL